MLVHHADAVVDRVARRAETHVTAFNTQRAGIRLVQAGQHAHQRRLAGAVLAQQRVNLTGQRGEADIVVRDHAGEAFGDAG